MTVTIFIPIVTSCELHGGTCQLVTNLFYYHNRINVVLELGRQNDICVTK